MPLVAARGEVAAAARDGWRQRPAIAEKARHRRHGSGGNPASDALEAYAIVSDGWRLIHNVANRGERPEFELVRSRQGPARI